MLILSTFWACALLIVNFAILEHIQRWQLTTYVEITVFPRIERAHSINFILLLIGGLYEVRVVIGGALY